MEVKMGIEKFKPYFRLKYFLPVLCVTSFMAVLLRILQYFTVIDLQTGFFDQNSFLVVLLDLLLVLFTLYLTFQSGFEPPKTRRMYAGRQQKPQSVFSALLGVLLIGAGARVLYGDAAVQAGLRPILLLEGLLSAAAGVAFLYHAFLLWQKKTKKLEDHIWLTIPAVWSLFRLMSEFLRQTTIAGVSQNVLDILFYADAVIFLFYLARFTAGLLSEKGEKVLFWSGALLVVIGVVFTLPPLFYRLFGGVGNVHAGWPDFVAMALTLFAGGVVVMLVQNSAKRADDSYDLDCDYGYETVFVKKLKL